MTLRLKKFCFEQKNESSFEEWQIYHNRKMIGSATLYTIHLASWCCKECLMQFVDEHAPEGCKICDLLCADTFYGITLSIEDQARTLHVDKFVLVERLEIDSEHRGKGLGRSALKEIADRKFKEGIDTLLLTPGPFDSHHMTGLEIEIAIQKITRSYEQVGFCSFSKADMAMMYLRGQNKNDNTEDKCSASRRAMVRNASATSSRQWRRSAAAPGSMSRLQVVSR